MIKSSLVIDIISSYFSLLIIVVIGAFIVKIHNLKVLNQVSLIREFFYDVYSEIRRLGFVTSCRLSFKTTICSKYCQIQDYPLYKFQLLYLIERLHKSIH